MNLKQFILILGGFFILQVNAQVNKYANAFLDIGIGARNLGMSGAVAGLNEDVTSAYWNPAGLVHMKRDIQIGAMHNEHFAGIVKYDYGGIAYKFNENSAGAFTFIRSGVDDIPNTLELVDANGVVNYDKVTGFSVADYAFIFTYSRTFKNIKGLSIGGNVKIIHRYIGQFGSGWGFGIDVAAKYKLRTWDFTAVLKDATTTVTNFNYNTEVFRLVFAQTGNEIISTSTEIATPRLILAASKRFRLPKNFAISAEIDLINTFDGRRNVLAAAGPWSLDPCLGIEFEYNDLVFLRGGIGKFQYLKNVNNGKDFNLLPTIGVGFKYKAVSVDYTLANFGSAAVGLSHVISARVDLFKKKPESKIVRPSI